MNMPEDADGIDKTTSPSLNNRNSSIIGALTAGGRSMVYQMTTFYFRTPLKLFRPARFDYLHYLRVVLTGEENNKQSLSNKQSISGRLISFFNPRYFYYLENSSLGILTKALNKYGWKVIPDRILPPLVANSATGVVLYTTYLTSLNYFSNKDLGTSLRSPWDVWRSGFIAGSIQALVSTPIDAIYTRSSTDDLLLSAKKYDNLWLYGRDKLKEIGLVGCFGGFGITLIKESFAFAVYFTTFELIKGQICQSLISLIKQYAQLKYIITNTTLSSIISPTKSLPIENLPQREYITKKEEKWITRTFIFIGGISAAFLLQVVQFPFNKIQKIHLSRLEAFDIYHRSKQNSSQWSSANVTSTSITKMWVKSPGSTRFHIYYNSYIDTFEHIHFIHKNTNSLIKWLYKGFTRNTLAIIPGTTAGLLMLDYMRSSVEDKFISNEH